jgi:hypothetical protein
MKLAAALAALVLFAAPAEARRGGYYRSVTEAWFMGRRGVTRIMVR